VSISSRKNYNINTLRGATNDDDMDVCKTLGLDPSLAYTKNIIQAQLDRDVDPKLHKEVLHKLKKHM
tara:strand:+ start:14575 stop:14775 length:201 start_codon:yes stop_codon:yes gene_type:complete